MSQETKQFKLIKNSGDDGGILPPVKIDAEKMQVIHKLSALLAQGCFDTEYIANLCWALEQRARVKRAEQLCQA
jgi:hypothetical protein